MSFQSPAPQFDAVIASVAALTQRDIVATAKRLHADVMATEPRPLNFVRHVDGVEAPEEAIKPGGVIVYDYNRLDIIAKRAMQILRDLSPVGSGHDPHPGLYRDSHRLFVDGNPVDSLAGWHDGQEISIANTVVYSQVIEVGGKGGKKFKIDGGGRVYQRAQQILKRDPDVANAAFIEFTFRAVLGGGQVNQATAGVNPLLGVSATRVGGTGKTRTRFAVGNQSGRRALGVRAHNISEVRWPTIVIHPSSDRPGRYN